MTAIRTLTLRMTSKVTEVFGLNLFQHFHKPLLFFIITGSRGGRGELFCLNTTFPCDGRRGVSEAKQRVSEGRGYSRASYE